MYEELDAVTLARYAADPGHIPPQYAALRRSLARGRRKTSKFGPMFDSEHERAMFQQIQDRLEASEFFALGASVNVFSAALKRNTPVRTGRLRRSVRRAGPWFTKRAVGRGRAAGQRFRRIRAEVVVGGKPFTGLDQKGRRGASYAGFLEYGTVRFAARPFIAPTMLAQGGNIFQEAARAAQVGWALYRNVPLETPGTGAGATARFSAPFRRLI